MNPVPSIANTTIRRRHDCEPPRDTFLDQVIALLPAMRAFGLALCADPARVDDLVQDAVINAHYHREQFRPGSNLRAWLFTIVRNCYYSEMRRRKFEIEDHDDLHALSLSVELEPTASLQLEELDRALQKLSEPQRTALMLVHVSGLPYDKVAQQCGVAVGTVKSRIARARMQLARWIDAPSAC